MRRAPTAKHIADHSNNNLTPNLAVKAPMRAEVTRMTRVIGTKPMPAISGLSSSTCCMYSVPRNTETVAPPAVSIHIMLP